MIKKMKYCILFFLLLTVSFDLFPQEAKKSPDKAKNSQIDAFVNVSVRFIFPLPEIGLLAFCDFGAGIGYNIIPKRYSIGIACDAAIGVDWFSIFITDKKTKSSNQYGLSLGCRIYNSIKISNFAIIPFFGSDFMFVIFPMPYVGMEIAYKKFGIEYAFYLPELSIAPASHQLSLKMRL